MIEIKLVTKSGNIPAYETEGSAGMDLKAVLNEPVVLAPGERRLIPTGLFIELPQGYEAQVRARSGLAIKHGITSLSSCSPHLHWPKSRLSHLIFDIIFYGF